MMMHLNQLWQRINNRNRVQPESVLSSFSERGFKSVLSWSISIALFSLGVLDILSASFKLDLFLVLALAVAVKFPSFPSKSIRAQIILSLCTIGSFGWDLFILIQRVNTSSQYSYASVVCIRFFSAIMMLSKTIIFVEFLRNVAGANRVRKYLHRRFRLFLFPFEQPKRIMRDVRGRFLALAWLHVASFIMFIILWMVLVFALDYNLYFLTAFSAKYITWFLVGKAFTTLLCILGLWYDIDVCLCFLYFGCCVFTMPAIRRYIRQRRAALGGYPLAVSFYPFRFTLWQILKGLDLIVGVGLWVIIGLNAGAKDIVEATMYIYLASLAFVLFVSDVWTLLIVFGIRWLLRRKKMLQKLPAALREVIPSAQAAVNSDDSELDEFNLRCPEPITPETSKTTSKTSSYKHKKKKKNTSDTNSNKTKLKYKKEDFSGKRRKHSYNPIKDNIKVAPTSVSSLMTAFMYPGRYLQEDGDVFSDSDDSATEKLISFDGEHTNIANDVHHRNIVDTSDIDMEWGELSQVKEWKSGRMKPQSKRFVSST